MRFLKKRIRFLVWRLGTRLVHWAMPGGQISSVQVGTQGRRVVLTVEGIRLAGDVRDARIISSALFMAAQQAAGEPRFKYGQPLSAS